MARSTERFTSEIGLPPAPPWVRNLLIALFALYVLELLAGSIGPQPISLLAWSTLEVRPWELLTRYLVNGNNVTGVVFGLLALYFILPTVESSLGWRGFLQAMAFAAIGGTGLAFLLSVVGFVAPITFGWIGFVTAIFALFGLTNPDATVRMYLLIPVQARFFTWGSGIIAALFVLAARTGVTADALGCWLGAIAWWYLLGPGGTARRRRDLGKKVEKDLRKFTVLQGGNDNRDDLVN